MLYEILLMIAVASLLILAVIVVKRRRSQVVSKRGRKTPEANPNQTSYAIFAHSSSKAKRTIMLTNEPPADGEGGLKDFIFPPGSLHFDHLILGQSFSVQTETATYVLTLRDALVRRFETVRLGRLSDDTETEEAFDILFRGSQLPDHGYVHGWFIVGGRMTFMKARDGVVYGFSTTTKVIGITRPIESQQAS
jgi:hypothetical protein